MLYEVITTYDHRVIQGAESGEFLRTMDALLQGADGFYEQVSASLGVVSVIPGPQRGEGGPGSTAAAPTVPGLALVAAGMGLVDHIRRITSYNVCYTKLLRAT